MRNQFAGGIFDSTKIIIQGRNVHLCEWSSTLTQTRRPATALIPMPSHDIWTESHRAILLATARSCQLPIWIYEVYVSWQNRTRYTCIAISFGNKMRPAGNDICERRANRFVVFFQNNTFVTKILPTMEKHFKRTLITTGMPYANGPVLSVTQGVAPADINTPVTFVWKKEEVPMIEDLTNTAPITLRAKRARRRGGLSSIIISLSQNVREFSAIHLISIPVPTSRDVYRGGFESSSKLMTKGTIENQHAILWRGEAKEVRWPLYHRHVSSLRQWKSPHGDQCEKCGTSPVLRNWSTGSQAISGSSKPVMRETKHWYLPSWQMGTVPASLILDEHGMEDQCLRTVQELARHGLKSLPLPMRFGLGSVLCPSKELWRQSTLRLVWCAIGYISNTKSCCPILGKNGGKIPRHAWSISSEKTTSSSIASSSRHTPRLKVRLICLTMCRANNSSISGWQDLHIAQLGHLAQRYLVEKKQDVLCYVLTANAPETKGQTIFTWKDYRARNK